MPDTNQLKKRKSLFRLIILEISVYDQLFLLLWDYGEGSISWRKKALIKLSSS
jgi:hypothetical protein